MLAKLSRRYLVHAVLLPDFPQRQDASARWRLYLVRKRSWLKHRIHAQPLPFGHTCPVNDLFGTTGRRLLAVWRSWAVALRGARDERPRPVERPSFRAMARKDGRSTGAARKDGRPTLRAAAPALPDPAYRGHPWSVAT